MKGLERAAGLGMDRQREKVVVVGMTIKQTGRLAERVELSVGMKVMVILNIATEGDVANGTRGIIEDIILDPRERLSKPDEEGKIWLEYPPAVVLFKPDICPFERFDGLPVGIIPISLSSRPFQVTTRNNKKHSLRRRRLAVTPAYAFTDFKSQGQTIEHVIVDLAKPPSGDLTPFTAYVALSRSRGRDTIRREYDESLFTTHPCEELREEDGRLEKLDRETANTYNTYIVNRHDEDEGVKQTKRAAHGKV